MLCCGNISVSRTFVSASKTVIEKTFKLETGVSIKPSKATIIKGNSHKLPKNQQ